MHQCAADHLVALESDVTALAHRWSDGRIGDRSSRAQEHAVERLGVQPGDDKAARRL
jgi:hypothetical protein